MSVPTSPWLCIGRGPGLHHCCIHVRRMKEGMAYRCCSCNNSAGPGEPHPPLPEPYPPDVQHGALQMGWPARRG
jgi:hypothetical protein